jgi:hypothetical protein
VSDFKFYGERIEIEVPKSVARFLELLDEKDRHEQQVYLLRLMNKLIPLNPDGTDPLDTPEG